MPDCAYRPLPVTIEEITPEWLTAALRAQVPDVTVKGCEIVDMIRGTCTKIRLRLDLDEAGRSAGIPERVILKGGFEPHSRDLDFMHEKEVRGYRDVLPVLGLPSPKSWFADFDAGRRQGIVIMEDLVVRGVSFCDPLVPQGYDAVARRLEVLAGYHAQTYGSAELQPGGKWGWVKPSLIDQAAYHRELLTADMWNVYIGSPRGAAASVRFHDQAWMRGALDRMARFGATLPQALLHCDTHLGNLYVDRDGAPGFFDSLPVQAPPMKEVAYHLACALDTADRARWEHALVGHYLDALRRHGIDAPSFDDAMRQYGIFLAFAYSVFIVNAEIFQPEPVNTAYTARISAAMIDHDTIGLLNAIPFA